MWVHKQIPDDTRITRLIFYPFMFDNDALDPRVTFQFKYRETTGKRQESLIWRLYAPLDYLISCLGCVQQQEKNRRKAADGKEPSVRYAGHMNALSGAIRTIQTDRDYRFELIHAPEEGIYHLHVLIVPPGSTTLERVNKTVLNDLRDELFRVFTDLKGRDYDGSTPSACRLVTSQFVINTYACFAVLGLLLKQGLKPS